MEPPACAVKRKKRRTRKCLDEIRKRSRHNSVCDANPVSETFDKSKKSSKTIETTKISSHNHHNANITSKRLTLNPTMLSKTVKSETITRALLTSKHQEQWSKPVSPETSVNAAISISSQESIKEIPRQPENQSNSCTATDTDSESLVIANEIEEISFHDDSDRENVSPKSMILFSPISRAIPGAAAASRGGSPTPRAAHRLYAECVRELPARMLEIAGEAGAVARLRLARHDAMDGVRTFLRDLYADTLRLETEGNILRDINGIARSVAIPDEPPKTIVENPREYLSMGTVRRRTALRELNGDASTAHGPAPHARHSAPTPPPPHELSSSSTEAPQLSIIHDTPEYIYYPRKMNQ